MVKQFVVDKSNLDPDDKKQFGIRLHSGQNQVERNLFESMSSKLEN